MVEPPRIEFPCDYPIKVLGEVSAGFEDMVVHIMHKHDPEFDPASATQSDSRNGNYVSIRAVIRATGEDQLQALFAELKQTGRVKMVL
ncbi:MAG: HP0495 family protein [Pseudomonadales bacterium]